MSTNAADIKTERTRDKAHATRAQEGAHPPSRVEEDEWVQGQVTPLPRPGYEQRWVRIDLMSQADSANVTRRFAEGWRPRPANTVEGIADMGYQLNAKGTYAGAIVDRDRILCEMPIERADARRRAMAARTDRMNDAINNDLHKHIPKDKLALEERRTKVALGTNKPRVPPTQDDDA